MQNILLFAIYGRGLEPFGGAKTGELIASIDSPPPSIVVKKGILDPSPFSGKIRQVEARSGKLAKIKQVETN